MANRFITPEILQSPKPVAVVKQCRIVPFYYDTVCGTCCVVNADCDTNLLLQKPGKATALETHFSVSTYAFGVVHAFRRVPMPLVVLAVAKDSCQLVDVVLLAGDFG